VSVPQSDAEVVQHYLAEHVASLPRDLFDDLSVPIGPRLEHAQMLALVFAAQRLAPQVSRDAFANGATGADLIEWLAPALVRTSRPLSGASGAPEGRSRYRSPHATLRPVTSADVDHLYLATQQPDASHRGWLHGRTCSPSEFRSMLFDSAVLAQYVVVDAATGESAGLVTSHDANLVSGTCTVATQRIDDGPTSRPAGELVLEGTMLFIQYLFDHFQLRKVYLEVPEYDAEPITADPGSVLEEEGRFRDHYYWGDRYWDLITYAVYRTRVDDLLANRSPGPADARRVD